MTITPPLAIKYLTNDAYQREVDGCCDGQHFDECLSVVIEAGKREMERGHVDMTDIEQRKAAAFEWIENLGILIPYDIGLTLLQVLKPFPQAPDSEVDEAIKYMQDLVDCIDEEGLDRENNQRHYRALIKAVQQPRQEWMDISTAPRDGTELLAIVMGCDSGKLKRIVISYSIDQDCWLFDGSEISNAWNIIAWTTLKPLPEPPKDKP